MPCQGENCDGPGVYDTKTDWYGHRSLCPECVEEQSEKHVSFCIIAGPEMLPREEQEEMAADLGMSRDEMLVTT